MVSQGDLVLALIALIPGALIVFFAFHDGGYFAGAIGIVIVELALLILLRVVLARVPWEGFGVALIVATVALGFLAAWTLASQGWSHAPIRAITEYDRVLLYLLTLIFFGSFGFSAQRIRWMVYGVAGAIVVVCVAAFLARTLPSLIGYDEGLSPERLRYPLSYWNALGFLAATGTIFCIHFACNTREPWFVRVAGSAAVPLLATVLFYTFSRGAVWVLPVALVAYVVIGRPRGLLSGVVSVVPPTALALRAADPVEQLTRSPSSHSAISAGHRIALTVGLCVLGAAVLRAALLALDKQVDRIEIPVHRRRLLLVGGTAVAVVLAGVLCVALDVPSTVHDKYRQFSNADDVRGTGTHNDTAGRLGNLSGNGRQEHWEVARRAFRAHPLRGTGAATWEIEWTRERRVAAPSQNALSLYFEELSDLGLPGLVAVAAVLLLLLGAFLVRARGPDRALFAALFGAGLAWMIHAGVDMDWEMPVVSIWLFALGGCALARSPGETRTLPRWTIALRVLAAVACVGVAVLPLRVAQSQKHIDASLTALHDGDCATARGEARQALDVMSVRPTPYHVVAFCDLEQGRPTAAIAPLRQAVEQDPNNWEFHHALAVALGRAGLDPRAETSKALEMNPAADLTIDASKALGGSRPASWRRAARGLQLTPPGPPSL
jgi:hypothetical protein